MKKNDVLLLDQIRIDGGTQPRESIDVDYVAELADVEEKSLPPVVVFHDGTDFWLADGFHRFHATAKRGAKGIRVEIRKGTQRDAQWYSLGANQGHGLRRSNADKRKAVGVALADPEWAKMSDRVIAEHIGVDNKTVAACRPTEEVPQLRTGKDGKVRKGPPPARPRPPGGTESESKSTSVAPDAGDGGERLGSAGEASAMLARNAVEDEAGRMVEETPVLEALLRVPEFKELKERAQQLSRDINTLGMEAIGHQIRRQQTTQDLCNVAAAIKFAIPYTTCPNSPRVCANGCKWCSGQRWVTKEIWDRIPAAQQASK